MITLIYRGIIAVVLIFTIWNLFDEEKITLQANAARSDSAYFKIIDD